MPFTDYAWHNIENIYNSILEMQFIRELETGSLNRDIFQNYMIQDAIYLGEFSRTLAVIAAKAPTPELQLQFIRNAQDAIVVERSLHEEFFSEFEVSTQVALASQPSPTCLNYTNFLLATAYQSSFAVGVAAVLPCFWIYLEVGKHIYQQSTNQANPYQKWIDTYVDDYFANSVQEVIEVTNQMASRVGEQELKLMHQVFYRASQFE